MIWLYQAAKVGSVKNLAEAIRAFFKMNNRMPSQREKNTMGSILQDITKKSNVVDIRSRFKDSWWKARSKQGIKKADEDPTSAMYDRHIKEIEGIDKNQGMGFYSELGDMMKKHRREELESAYDEMYNKILNKAKRIESDPLPLLEAELGKKLTGKETTTELLEIFKNRPKKASGGIAGQLHLYDGGRVPFLKGKIVQGLKGFDKGRRDFLKKLGAFFGTGIAAGTGILKLGSKTAPKAVAPAAEVITRGADGMPSYAWDLIEVVKAKGTKDIMEGLYRRSPPQKKYTYKGVEVTEDGLGNTSVQKQQTKTGHWYDEATDDSVVDDYVDREIGFEIKDGGYEPKDYDSLTKAPDEYNESTAYMQGDPDGGMDVSEIVEKIDDADHLELKQIADEVIDIRPKKAEGGRVSLSKGGLANILGV